MTRTITWERNGQTEQQTETKVRYGWTGAQEEEERKHLGWRVAEIEIQEGRQ